MLKKILAVFVLLVLVMPLSSFGVTQTFDQDNPILPDDPDGTALDDPIFTPSNNVNGVVVNSNSRYSVIAKHLNGSRNFASSSTDTAIYWTDVAEDNEGTEDFEIELQNSDTSDFSGTDWNEL